MITKKEDLYKTYVVNEPEIRGLYVGLCNKFGIEHETNANDSGSIDIMNAEYIEVYAGICFYTNMPSKETSKQLTLEDLTPQAKEVEWVNGLPPVGEECEALDPDDDVWRVVKILDAKTRDNEIAVTSVSDIGLFGKLFWAVDFRKLESPEAKKEREELERKAMITNEMCLSVTSLKPSQAIALYEAGYRKESE